MWPMGLLYIKVFYVMGKVLTGELSCPCDRSCVSLGKTTRPSISYLTCVPAETQTHSVERVKDLRFGPLNHLAMMARLWFVLQCFTYIAVLCGMVHL